MVAMSVSLDDMLEVLVAISLSLDEILVALVEMLDELEFISDSTFEIEPAKVPSISASFKIVIVPCVCPRKVTGIKITSY